MSSQKIVKARELIDQGKYAQARSILKNIKDPKAQRMLAEIDDLEPENSVGGGRLKDIIQVVLMALVFTAVFAGAGYAIASGMGIPKSVGATSVVNLPQPTQSAGLDSTTVAVVPTAIPTATEIPCEAQAWWETNRAGLNEAVNLVLAATVQTPGGQINNAKNAFTAWKATFDSQAVAPCVEAAHQAIANAVPSVNAVFDSYLSPTTDQQRAQTFVQAMDALLRSADAITTLSVTSADDTWIAEVQAFTNGECPAKRWYIETVQGRDYARFFTLFSSLDFAQTGTTDTTLREMKSLRGSFAAESAAFPPCVKPASDSLVRSMDGFISYGNDRLSGDMGSADVHLQTGNNELLNFYMELGRVDATLGSVRLK